MKRKVVYSGILNYILAFELMICVVYSARFENESNMASDATIEAKHHFLEWCRQNDRTKFSLLITGKSGVGKSSLVNTLVGKQVAEERCDNVHFTVEKVIPYDVYVEYFEDVKVRVWDSPGLMDDDDDAEGGAGKDEEYLAKMESEITEDLDVVVLCLKMDDKRFHRDDKDTFKILTETFGKELWKNVVIALTFANKVEDPAADNKEAYFEHDLANWREVIHSFLSNTLKLDPALVNSLPIVPTGYHCPLSVLPNGGNWLSEFWKACNNVAGNHDFTPFRLYRFKKDEEQPDSFWKNPLKIIKTVNDLLGVTRVVGQAVRALRGLVA